MSRIPAHGSRRDGNEPAVIAALEAAGCIVKQLSDRGLPDLVVMVPGTADRAGVVSLLEVKAGAGKLRPDQSKFFELVRGKQLPIFVVRSPAEALAAIGLRVPGAA